MKNKQDNCASTPNQRKVRRETETNKMMIQEWKSNANVFECGKRNLGGDHVVKFETKSWATSATGDSTKGRNISSHREEQTTVGKPSERNKGTWTRY